MYSLIDEFLKSWDRPVREVTGWKATQTEFGTLIVANVLGISKENIKVNLEKATLSLKGETEVKEIEFTNKVNYAWNISNIIADLENIEYEVKDGLVYIFLYTSKEKKRKIAIDYKK